MTRHRTAREAINIVGNIANKLFDVLDSEYAETISKTLTQISNNEDVLSKMIKNQITVMDSTLNIFSKTTEAVAVKMNQLQDETNKIVDYTNHNTKPNSLPFNQEDVIHLYTLMSSQSGITQDHLIVVLQLPLIYHEDFDLFNLVPIPATVNNTMMTIVPEASFLAATPHRDQYFALTREQYKECMTFKQPENKLLCLDKQSKYNIGSQAYACEFNLLKNISDNTCNVQETKSNIIWSPLYHANQWIFGSKNNTTVTAVCKGITTHLELQGATLLKLQDDCVLKHQTYTIQTHQTLTDTMYESYIAFGSSLNLSNELKQLKLLHNTLKDEKFAELPHKLQTDSMHHYAINSTTLILVVGAIIWMIWKIKQVKRPEVNQPTQTLTPNAMPRTRFTLEPETIT
ncbi:uncharacterized protein LOC119688677 [Teleopsis dalmanni]|uniref:uncharacterized protein LOC119688677 n=1 Tax=Teleopsis dalmanni TaxID=139649 RepID=UPI0018CFAE87|nr:uncharacterized protein LOC119688677 [Teleopsis dalmanni]